MEEGRPSFRLQERPQGQETGASCGDRSQSVGPEQEGQDEEEKEDDEEGDGQEEVAMPKKPYKLKIVLGKRQYRSGPTDSKMKSTLAEIPGHGALKVKKARKPKVTASAMRLKNISKRLGS